MMTPEQAKELLVEINHLAHLNACAAYSSGMKRVSKSRKQIITDGYLADIRVAWKQIKNTLQCFLLEQEIKSEQS